MGISNICYDLNVRSLRSPQKFSPIGPLPSREWQHGSGQGFDKTYQLVYNGGMKRETIGGSGCDRWGHEHGARGRSLTLGIQYHGHGRHGNVVESMDVIGHGRETRGVVKVLALALHLNYELNGRQNHESRIQSKYE